MIGIRLARWVSVDDIGHHDAADWPIGSSRIVAKIASACLSDPSG